MLKRYKSATVSIGALLYYIWAATNVRAKVHKKNTVQITNNLCRFNVIVINYHQITHDGSSLKTHSTFVGAMSVWSIWRSQAVISSISGIWLHCCCQKTEKCIHIQYVLITYFFGSVWHGEKLCNVLLFKAPRIWAPHYGLGECFIIILKCKHHWVYQQHHMRITCVYNRYMIF